jgi:hypothetical protein
MEQQQSALGELEISLGKKLTQERKRLIIQFMNVVIGGILRPKLWCGTRESV